jgi:hypothetical protein
MAADARHAVVNRFAFGRVNRRSLFFFSGVTHRGNRQHCDKQGLHNWKKHSVHSNTLRLEIKILANGSGLIVSYRRAIAAQQQITPYCTIAFRHLRAFIAAFIRPLCLYFGKPAFSPP